MKTPLCCAPWTLYVGADEKFDLCCITREIKGNYSSFEEFWNSEEIRNIRKQMLSDTLPDFCYKCNKDSSHLNNLVYKDVLNRYSDTDLSEMVDKTDLDGYTTFLPNIIDVRTNLCNFKCMTCGDRSSSSIRSSKIKKSIKVNPIGTINTLEQMGLTDHVIQNLKFIRWAGGEPFMSPVHWQVMDKLVKFNKNPIITYDTNLSFPGKTYEKSVSLLNNFSNIRMFISLDGVGKDVEYIRSGIDYDLFLDNLKILSEVEFIEKSIQYVATSIGLLTLPDVIKLCNENDLVFCGKLAVGFSKNHFLDYRVLNQETFEKCMNETLLVSQDCSKYNKKIVKLFVDMLRSKYEPRDCDCSRLKFDEDLRDNESGYFLRRMEGKLNTIINV